MATPQLNTLDPVSAAAVYAHYGENAPRIRVMDDVTLFDVQSMLADANGDIQVNQTFFSTSKGQHPLGEDGTNVETAGQVPESKLYIVKGLRIAFSINSFPAAITVDEKQAAIAIGELGMKMAIVTTKEGSDRTIERGMVMDFPAGTNFETINNGMVDNPAAAALYLAQLPYAQNGADLYGASHRWSIPWVLPAKRQFSVKLSRTTPIQFGAADFEDTQAVVRVAMDMTVLTFV